MDFHTTSTILITCGRMQADRCAAEVESLGFDVERAHKASVETEGTLADCMMLNLWLRSAFSVLYLLKSFDCHDPNELYDGIYEVPWEEIISPDEYLSVNSRVDHPTVNNSMFPSLKTKDAIVDRIADKHGRRPDSGADRKGVVVTLYWRNDLAHIYINTSGDNLSNRGYRKIPGKAPLQEALSASILRAMGYDGTQPIVLPMCGTGSLAIEAALIARNRAPGLLRNNFGHQHVTGFDEKAWSDLRFSAKKSTLKMAPAPIIASDIDPLMIEGAKKNALTAGVENQVEFHTCDFADTPMPSVPGILIVNPEYGQRLGDMDALGPIYERLGDFFKKKCPEWTCGVFTGNRELANHISLRASRRVPMMNADIECRLLQYDMWEGKEQEATEHQSDEATM